MRSPRLFALLVAAAVVFTTTLGTGRVANAAAPTATNSYYISAHWFNDYNHFTTNGQSIWWNFGYNVDNVAGVTIMSFGQPCIVNNVYGFNTWLLGCVSYADVILYMKSVQSGYDSNLTHTNTLIFAVGTNSSGTWPGANYQDAGWAFSKNLLSQLPNTAHTAVYGAIDAEAELNWTSASTIAIPFANGFDINWPSTPRTILMYDYGYLHEASWNATTNTPSFPYGYSASEHNMLAWGYRASYPFFEQYNAGWATWITHMSLFSKNNKTSPTNVIYGAWYVPGVLAGETFEPLAQAWQDVLNALNTSGLSQSTIDYLSWQRTLN